MQTNPRHLSAADSWGGDQVRRPEQRLGYLSRLFALPIDFKEGKSQCPKCTTNLAAEFPDAIGDARAPHHRRRIAVRHAQQLAKPTVRTTATHKKAASKFKSVSAETAKKAKKGTTSSSRTGKSRQATVEFGKPPKHIWVRVDTRPNYRQMNVPVYIDKDRDQTYYVSPEFYESDAIPGALQACMRANRHLHSRACRRQLPVVDGRRERQQMAQGRRRRGHGGDGRLRSRRGIQAAQHVPNHARARKTSRRRSSRRWAASSPCWSRRSMAS